jgi:hypothetical protein
MEDVENDTNEEDNDNDSMSDGNSKDNNEDQHANMEDVKWWENIDKQDLEEIEDVIYLFEGIFGKKMLDKHLLSELLGDEDEKDGIWEELDTLMILLKEKKKKHQPKHHLQRKNSSKQTSDPLASKLFDVQFHMPKEYLDFLVDALHSDITVDPTKSKNSTRANQRRDCSQNWN